MPEPPGTIAYTGHFNDVEISIERIEYNEDVILRSQVNAVSGPFEDGKVYWFNVIGLHDINLINEIEKNSVCIIWIWRILCRFLNGAK
jgi:hypothetical protein